MNISKIGHSYHTTLEYPGDKLRIATLTSDDPHHLFLLDILARQFVLTTCIVEPSASQQRNLWKRQRYIDWLARGWHVRRQQFTGRTRYRKQYFMSLIENEMEWKSKIFEVESVNSDSVVEQLRCMRPDIVVVCGTGYISKRVIESCSLMINIHGGYLPDYKGNHCVFFAYLNGDYTKIGSSLHLVAPQLDGGDLIEVIQPPIYPHDNDEHLYCRSVHLAIERLTILLTENEVGKQPIVCRMQPIAGRTYRHRDRLPWLDLRVAVSRWLRQRHVPHLPSQTTTHAHSQTLLRQSDTTSHHT